MTFGSTSVEGLFSVMSVARFGRGRPRAEGEPGPRRELEAGSSLRDDDEAVGWNVTDHLAPWLGLG